MSYDFFPDNDGGTVACNDGGDEATRRVVVATLDFVASEIVRNLRSDDPGVASVLHMVQAMSFDTKAPQDKGRDDMEALSTGARIPLFLH